MCSDPFGVCPSGESEQPLENFHKDSRLKDGRRALCKFCSNEYQRKYKDAKQRRGWALTDSGKICSRCNTELSIEAFPPEPRYSGGVGSWCNRCRADNIKGLSVGARTELLTRQGGACAGGCGFVFDVFSGPGKGYEVDHDHGCCPEERACGKCIVGLVCHKCNVTNVLHPAR